MKKLKSFLNKPSIKDLGNSVPLFSIIFIAGFIIAAAILTLDPSNIHEGKLLAFESYAKAYNMEWGTFTANGEYETLVYYIIPFLLGLSQFMFLHYKKQCYSVLSFPVSRKTIFNNRVVFPFIIIPIALVIIKLIALSQNIAIFGLSFELIFFWLEHILRIFSITLFSYTTAIVFSILCGRYLEAAFAGFSFLALPLAVIKTVSYIWEEAFFGLEIWPSFLSSSLILEYISMFSQYFVGSFIMHNALTFKEKIDVTLIVISLLYIILSVVALILIKRYFIKGHKAENSGFKGVSKIANFIICFTPAVFASVFVMGAVMSGFLKIRQIKTLPIFYLSGILTALIVAYIIGIIIHFSPKKALKALVSGGAVGGGIIVVAVVCAVCGLSVFNKVPSAEDVEEIRFSSPYRISYESTENEPVNMGVLNGYEYCFTSEKDITLTLELLESALENRDQNVGQDMTFYIRTKDGEMINARFDLSNTVTSKKSLELWETDAVKERIENLLFPERFPVETTFEGENPPKEPKIKYNESSVTITSLYNVKTKKALSENDLNKLRDAALKDSLKLTVEEKYFPNSKLYGTVIFSLQLDGLTSLREGYSASSTACQIPVHENSVNTIKALKELNLYESLFKEQEIVNAYTMDLEELRTFRINEYRFTPPSLWYNADSGNLITKEKFDTSKANQILDPNKIDELITNSQRYYYTEGSEMQALIVEYKEPSDAYTIYFLP